MTIPEFIEPYSTHLKYGVRRHSGDGTSRGLQVRSLPVPFGGLRMIIGILIGLVIGGLLVLGAIVVTFAGMRW